MSLQISIISSFLFSFFSLCIYAQETISLQNASFEDIPRKGGTFSSPIKGWHDCAQARFPGETPPDIHPVPGTAWAVSKTPYDGLTFLGMVTRQNDSYESLSQALTSPIKGGVCYSFEAFISRSELYKSATSRTQQLGTQELENFVRPAVLQIWGGNSFCDKAELLGESPAVSNTEWKQYKFLFQPQRTYKYITLEAFYKTPILEAYNGHVLVDGLSEIKPVDCPLIPQDLVAEVSEPPSKISQGPLSNIPFQGSAGKPKPGPSAKPADPVSVPTTPAPFKSVLLPELNGQKIFVGQKIRLNHLYFKADSVNLLPDSYKVLKELAAFLKAYPRTVIEIGGHTNTIPPDDYCNRLSALRAKSVQDYLITQGVPDTRLEYKGYGKQIPLIPYDKYNKDARFKNQRVEIKILSITGNG